MQRKLRRNEIFTMRLPEEQLQMIKQEADANERSVSAHFRIIIRNYFKKSAKKKEKN